MLSVASRSRCWWVPSGAVRVRPGIPSCLGLLSILLVIVALWPANALANTYQGLLYGGTLNITSSASSRSAGYVYGDDHWTAPSGTWFDGFVYTSAAFSSTSDNAVGGVSAGFGGNGSANQPTILFPGTDDCSITNSGHYWTNSNGSTLAGSNGRQRCNTSGNGSGWTWDNSELENANPGTDPYTGYQTLWLTVFCQAATCNYDSARQLGTAGVSVTNLSGDFIDSSNQPSGGAAWASTVSGGSWYQTDSGGIALNLSATDPAGVCALYGYLTGASAITGGVVGNQNPSITTVGGAIDEEYTYGTDPCWTGQTDTGTWTLPANLTSGTYNVGVAAANPGNYESQGFSAGGSPTIATYGSAIHIDDTTPILSWSGVPTGWTASTAETLEVTVGPSGLASVSCTDNGGNVAATLASGSTSGAGTTLWSVPTAVTGANVVHCSASNGDSNGALTGSGSQTFDVDTNVPVVDLADAGYVEGTWSNAAQAIDVSATDGPSGLHGIACSVDGGPEKLLTDLASASVDISTNGSHQLLCTATSNTGERGSATYTVNIDTEQPTLTFLVNGSASGSDWLSGTPIVSVIGSEQGGVLSGLSQITCAVNGGAPFPLSGIDASTEYTGSFELDQNGSDQVSCTGTTVAGTVQSTPTTVTVNVDNPNYAPDASALIDNGSDPYSDGPSQSQWYVTPQQVTITADNTGGSAPMAAIACKGALSGTWPISSLNTDAQGGEQITVTVSAPGGDLSCTAEDASGNVYVLGSYKFQVDDTAPTGYFVSSATWPEPDVIEIHATDNGGSGVALVRVYGESPDVSQGQPQLVGDAQYDRSTGNYAVTLPDGVAPWVAGNWTFYANVVDVAGNQGQITADADGSTEDLTLPLREDTAISATAQQVTATPDPAIPTGLARMASLQGLVSMASLRGETVHTAATQAAPPTLRSHTTIASAAQTAAHFAERTVSHHTVSHHTVSHRPVSRVLKVRFGHAVTLSGALKDVTHHGRPVSGAQIVVYQQLAGSHSYTRLGSTRTSLSGDYRYRVRPGATRTLYVVYPGSTLLRPAASQLREQSSGEVRIDASSIHAGGRLVITGVVKGGHIPKGGLEVTIDYRQQGAPGSGTLGTVHTDSRGRYSFTQRFSARTRGLVYELWAVVPGGQARWPYLGAVTGHVIRRVQAHGRSDL